MTNNPEGAGIFRRAVGKLEVIALSDGYLDASPSVMRNLDAAEAQRIFEQRPPRVSINAFALRVGGRLALIETGAGTSMGPTLGRLPQSLQAAGIDPADVQTVLLTHVHPDHSNGLVDASGRNLFPNAELVVHEKEVAHWFDDSMMAKVNESQRVRYFEAGRLQLSRYRAQLRTFASGEVFPGVLAVPAPGHTPGHTAYLITSGAESLLIWGDTVHIPEVQFARPEITMIYDSDPPAAAATRRRLFDMAASDKLLVAGMHLHFPGFARLAKDGAGYRAEP